MGLKESQQLTALLAIVFVVGLAGLFMAGLIPGLAGDSDMDLGPDQGSVYADSYKADIFLNGTLREEFNYLGESDMALTRPWSLPISFAALKYPYVEALNVAYHGGTVAYVRDREGKLEVFKRGDPLVFLESDMQNYRDIARLAEQSEAGCYYPERFDAGTQEIAYTFKMHPYVEYDQNHSHLNIMLANEHIPYENVTIAIHDPEGHIERLFVHPAMDVEKEPGVYLIKGSSPKNGLLEVEMLLKPEARELIKGFSRYIPDVEEKTLSANPPSAPERNLTISSKETLAAKSYRADFYLNGTLKEDVVCDVRESGRYRMLYRSWKMPLAKENISRPYVELVKIEVPEASTPYIKDWRGDVMVLSPDGTFYERRIYDLWPAAAAILPQTRANEAGYFAGPDSSRGSSVEYIFGLHPLIECDEEHCRISLIMAESHLPYRRLQIALHDPNGSVVQLFSRPRLKISHETDRWVMTGDLPRDQKLEMDMLLKASAKSSIDGFPVPLHDVEGVFMRADSDYSRNQMLFSGLSTLLALAVLLMPLFLLIVYRRYGSERTFTVPDILSYVPTKRKPWLVNLVFKGRTMDFDQDGFYATLLDLHRREFLRIDTGKGDKAGLRIELLKAPEATDDDYEKRVLRFLRDNGSGGIFDLQSFENKIESLRDLAETSEHSWSALSRLRDEMSDLMKEVDSSPAEEFFADNRMRAAKLLAIPLGLVVMTSILYASLGMTYPQIVYGIYASVIILIQSLIPALAPATLFGRWKRDYYEEKLQWDAFRSFLSDFVSIQKYAPQDLGIWKEWLVYGTALGVGDKVEEAMERLQIPALPELRAVIHITHDFSHAYSISSPPVFTRSESGSGGGGFGGGGGSGGFGGGGGGGGGGAGGR